MRIGIIKTTYYGLLLLIAMLTLACNRNNGSKPLKTNGENELVVLQPYDDFPDSLVTLVANGIKAKYKFDIRVLPRIPMAQENYWENDPSIYDGDKVLNSLHAKLPVDAFKIIGLVTKDVRDVTITEESNIGKKPKRKKKNTDYLSVSGYSSRGKGWGVVSTYSIYGGLFASSHKLWLANVTNHEIGHMLGLHHCDKFKDCIMDSGARVGIPGDTGTFCQSCKGQMSQFLLVK